MTAAFNANSCVCFDGVKQTASKRVAMPRDEIFAAKLAGLRPEPELTVSAWADQHRILPPEDPEPGQWRTARTPYLRDIMDALSPSSPYHTVVFCKGSQIGATECGNNWIGYCIHHAPGRLLAVMPTEGAARQLSKRRIAPMIASTPVISERINPDATNTDGRGTDNVLEKTFPGGSIMLTWASSPVGLSSIPVRYVLLDEVDRYERNTGQEGDPIDLAGRRTSNYRNRKIFVISTPTIKDASLIWPAFERTDQRYYHVPCPHCEHMQVIRWPRIVFEGGPSLACEGCGVLIEERYKPKMLAKGEWRPTAESADPGVIGFHLSALYSPLGWFSWGRAVKEFQASQGHPTKLQVWCNTVLGEPFEDREGDSLDEKSLSSRRGLWDAEAVPDDVIVATAGVDVQDDRLEVSLVGWCEGERARVLAHHVLSGSPGATAVWDACDKLLREVIPTDGGRDIRVVAACVDSGGHHTQAVYSWCAARHGRRVYAIKGVPGHKPAWPARASKSKKYRGAPVWMVGVDTIKDWLRGALAVKDENLPHHVSFSAALDDTYFEQLLVEKRVTTYDRSGRASRVWKKPKAARNEAWDALVYAFAALEAAKIDGRLKLIRPPKREPPTEEVSHETLRPSRFPPRRKGGFVQGWKNGR